MASAKYINNEQFLYALLQYRKEVLEAKKNKQEKPSLSDEIGLCFLKIAEHLSRKPNFVAYSFREEMISDAIENCFHPDTPVLTMEHGPVPISQLVGQTVTVKCIDGIWRPAEAKSFGRQRLLLYGIGSFNISLRHLKQSVIATPNHRWIVSNRVDEQGLFTNEQGVVTDLRLGDCLQNAPDVPKDPEGVIHGIIYGDGCLNKKTQTIGDTKIVLQGKEYPFIRVCKEDRYKDEIIQYLKDAGYQCTYPPSAKGDPVYYLGRKHGLKDLPHTHDPEYISGFLYGWWLADGSKTSASNRLIISSQNKDAIEWASKYVPYGGYQFWGLRETSGSTNFGDRILYTITLAPNSEYKPRVRSIAEWGESEVFCMVEPVTHTFTLGNGLLTGNCIQYAENFDPERSENPFSYFTQITYFAFLRRIAKEKRQLYIKYKATEQFSLTNENLLHDTDERMTPGVPMYKNITEFIQIYEKKRDEKKLNQKKPKIKGVEKFLED